MQTSHIGVSSYSLYATHYKASESVVWVRLDKANSTGVRSDSRVYNLNVDRKG